MIESQHFKEREQVTDFFNRNRYFEVISICTCDRFSEGFIVFYNNRALRSGCCPENIQHNIAELLEQVKDGKERYQVSSIFNKCVQSLARDAAPIQVIHDLVKVIDSLHDSLTDKILGK